MPQLVESDPMGECVSGFDGRPYNMVRVHWNKSQSVSQSRNQPTSLTVTWVRDPLQSVCHTFPINRYEYNETLIRRNAESQPQELIWRIWTVIIIPTSIKSNESLTCVTGHQRWPSNHGLSYLRCTLIFAPSEQCLCFSKENLSTWSWAQ